MRKLITTVLAALSLGAMMYVVVEELIPCLIGAGIYAWIIC